MQPPVDVSTLPLPVQKVLDPAGPRKLREGAAKGIVLGVGSPGDIVTIVAVLSEAQDAAIAATATQTLGQLKPQLLDGALSGTLFPGVLDLLAKHYATNESVVGRILESSGIAIHTVEWLAEHGSEMICERIATNEERLLAHPTIIDRLYMNRNTRMSTADRVLELAVRNGVELAIPAFAQASQAIKEELIAAPSAEPTYDDIVFREADEIAKTIKIDPALQDTHVLDEKGQEVVHEDAKPIWVQIGKMTMSQKIRRAMLGNSVERLLLVRDTNRLVAEAAIRSPLMQENDVVKISASRSVSDEVLRVIAKNKEWTKSHQVKFNLVTNPRTPLTFAAGLIVHMREHELKIIAKSKNVPGAVAKAAKQQLAKKAKGG